MALLCAPYMRANIYSMEAMMHNDLKPYEKLKYLLEEIVILSIPKGVMFVEPSMLCLKDIIFYDFIVKHYILIQGQEKTIDIKVFITITDDNVQVKIKSVYDNQTEIYTCFNNFISIKKNYIDISIFIKEKITLFIKHPSV